MTRELKGYHVLLIACCAFGVIIAANLTMLFAATGSFPGLVVKNSYVASQGWNDRTAGQQALGWTQSVSYAGGTVEIALNGRDGRAVELDGLAVTIGRPATQAGDRVFTVSGRAPFRIPVDLAPGRWRIEFHTTGAEPYQVSAALFVPEPG